MREWREIVNAKKFATVLGIIFIFMITGCGNSNSEEEPIGIDNNQINNMENEDISAEDAANILQEYLISVNKWESNYVLEQLDPVLREVKNEEVFGFEIRYMDDTDEVGGRLLDNYAITTDGQKIYWYNSADDEWVQQNG